MARKGAASPSRLKSSSIGGIGPLMKQKENEMEEDLDDLVSGFNQSRDAVERYRKLQLETGQKIKVKAMAEYGIKIGDRVRCTSGYHDRGKIIEVTRVSFSGPSEFNFHSRIKAGPHLLEVCGRYRLKSGGWSKRLIKTSLWEKVDDAEQQRAIDKAKRNAAIKRLRDTARELGVDVSDQVAAAEGVEA
jgi:hypothetical protein